MQIEVRSKIKDKSRIEVQNDLLASKSRSGAPDLDLLASRIPHHTKLDDHSSLKAHARR